MKVIFSNNEKSSSSNNSVLQPQTTMGIPFPFYKRFKRLVLPFQDEVVGSNVSFFQDQKIYFQLGPILSNFFAHTNVYNGIMLMQV